MWNKAGKKNSKELASQAFLDAPMEILGSDTLRVLDLCANTGIQRWQAHYNDAYNSNDAAHAGLTTFFSTIVIPS